MSRGGAPAGAPPRRSSAGRRRRGRPASLAAGAFGTGPTIAPVRHAIFLPPFRELADPDAVVDLAVAAEERGWDRFSSGTTSGGSSPQSAEVADPWIILSAIAAVTS